MASDLPRIMSAVEARLFAVKEARAAEIEQLLDEDPARCATIAGAALDVWAEFLRRRFRQRSIEGRA